MKEKDFTYLAEEFKRGIDNEISYIYSCFVPADAKNVLAVMKGNIAVADREFLSADTRVSVGNRWTCPYDLLLDRVESKVEDFYAEFDLSSKTLEKLSRYGERAELFKKEFRENLAKSEQTSKIQLLRELELMVMQGKDVKAVLKHMNTAIEKRTNALNSLLSSTAGQMERYMVLWDYQDNGYTQYRFITVGDNCEHCTELNGKVFDINDVTNFPPLHPNCNCRADILDKDGNSVATLQDIDADDKLDYLKTSLKQMLLGNYTEDTNLLGTLGQVALGFLGLDLPADIRDLLYDITHWKLTPSHAMQTILDAAALLPVVGSIKYSDEAADAVKGVVKHPNNAKIYTPVEYIGTVKVDGKMYDVSRKIYQRNDIDTNYFDKNTGLTNLERMRLGKPPIGLDGNPIQLHHILQKEKGTVVEIKEVTHQEYYSQLHGLGKDGSSFRNNPLLNKQYNNFRYNYWKWRAEQLTGGGINID